MKKLLAAAVLVAAIGAQVAHADPIAGHIHVGNPSTQVGPSITELTSACEPGGDTDGMDGQWFEVPAGATAVDVALAGGATGLEDLDVYSYGAGCTLIDDLSLVTGNTSEKGPLPTGATFIAVDLFVGAMADFTVTFS